MESAFGQSFSHVRVHNDASAAGLSERLNARAFTLGPHVAFGGQEYRPGTLAGDALIAHELAHVAQQGGAAEEIAPFARLPTVGGETSALEADADAAAVGAVASLWGGLRGALRGLAGERVPRSARGCGCSAARATTRRPRATAGPAPATPATPPRLTKTTDSGPTPTDCGGAEWVVQWLLDHPTAKGGWVVQKVETTFDVKDCAGKDLDIVKRTAGRVDPAWWPLWEAWEIHSKQKVTTYAEGGDTADDTFGMPAMGDKSKGTITIKGTAEFYDGLTLPKDFVATNKPPERESCR